MSGTVVLYSNQPSAYRGHESTTRAWVGARLSRILGYEYGGEYDAACRYSGRLYFIPSETLVEETAQALGIRDEHDLFGGVTPHAFLCSKAVAHSVIEGGFTPPGWSSAFGADLGDSVLHGYTAFTSDDAR